MRDDNRHNEILMSEEADRRFHELIATSTQNSASSPPCRCCGIPGPLTAEPFAGR